MAQTEIRGPTPSAAYKRIDKMLIDNRQPLNNIKGIKMGDPLCPPFPDPF
jgi:hypothetical protein